MEWIAAKPMMDELDERAQTDADAQPSSTLERVRTTIGERLFPIVVVSEYLDQRARQVPRKYFIAAGVALVALVVASNPAAAQEFCDDPAGTLLVNIETMLINYGTTLLFIAFLIGVAMWGLTPVFAGQSAVGLGMVLLSFGAAIAFVVGQQFFGMSFEAAGASGQSCSAVID